MSAHCLSNVYNSVTSGDVYNGLKNIYIKICGTNEHICEALQIFIHESEYAEVNTKRVVHLFCEVFSVF